MEQAAKYESALRRWSELSSAGAKASERNREVERMQSAFLALRETPEGRAVVEGLADDHDPRVRVWSAVHLTAWDRERGRAILISLTDEPGPTAMSAKWAVIELDKGKPLNEWTPGAE